MSRRRSLWLRQAGRCHYCKRMTVLPETLVEEYGGHPGRLGESVDVLLANPEFKARWHDDVATLEHLVPVSAGGGNAWRNLVVACAKCNQARGAAISPTPPRRKRQEPWQTWRPAYPGVRWSVVNDCWVRDYEA